MRTGGLLYFCNISAELPKEGDEAMTLGLHAILIGVWLMGAIPPD